MEKELRILIVDDSPADAELEVRELKRAGLRVTHQLVETEDAFRAALRDFQPKIIISDFSMPHFDGMFALALARELAPDVPFLFVSGTIGEEYAIRALKNGATDYVLKNNLVRLPAAVERALKDGEERAARRRAEEEIARQRVFLRQVIDLDRNRIFAKDREGRFTLVNQAMAEAYGTSVEGLVGKTNLDLVRDSEQAERIRKSDLEVMDGLKEVFIPEQQIADAAGNMRWFQVVKRPLLSADGKADMVLAVGTDITERKLQELKISRLNRILAMLSGINSTIVRVGNRQELFEEACRIAVEHGNFGLAWIGLYDPVTQDVTPVAWAGLGSDELKQGKSTARADVPLGQGLVGRAIRERTPTYSNDIAAEKGVGGKRRVEAIRLGYRSLIAMPLFTEGAVTGILALFAKEPGFFTDEEIKLLTELAGNISYALGHIAGQQKIEKLSRIRAISSEVNAAIVRSRNRQQLFYEACRIAVEHGRFGMAWIGELDPVKFEVRPVASTGLEDSSFLMRTILPVRADSPHGQGTLARAAREGRPVYNNDITAGVDTGGERRKEAVRLGFRSSIVLPLIVDGAVAGTFSMYAKELNYFDDEEVSQLIEVGTNISFALEHMARQEKIEKLSRIRAISGEVNAAIVRIRERKALLEETCRIASEHGKFEFVWVALLDQENKKVNPVAWAGFSAEAAHAVTWETISSAQGTLGEAIQTRKPAVRDDIETQLPAGKLRQNALEKGCHSTICLPLVVDDQVTALIALFAAGKGFFDNDERALLEEMAADVSFALDHIANEEKLDYLAYYDTLTGLPNRTLFHDRVSQALQAEREANGKAALIFFDLQRFGIVNDTYGRQTGDALLKLVAERLETVLGSRDYLARVGADTFATVLRDVKHEAEIAHALEQGILNTLREPFEIGGQELRIAAQAGIALFPGDGNDAETLFRNADAALKKAKDAGDVYLFYAPQMNARVAEQLKLENDLRNAIAQEQYVLHYQPRFDLANGQIIGMEALIRWRHPERGMVPPGEFITLLEETGMILDVGRWALRRAALEHAAWSGKGRLPPRIAVNVSPAQLRRKDFVDYVKEALAPIERATERIDIEITESMLMEDIEGSIDKLKALQAIGLHIALDDFGTGYSSLSYLARLPINSLKIDRSFIIQMNKSPEQMAIVSTVISLARALNLKVVAEGVETEEQANLLRLLRCDEVQGYLFGKPVPPEELDGKLRQA